MSRRKARAAGAMPVHLARFDWRDWRPPAAPDDPAPWYSTWYLGLHDWLDARQAWLAGPEKPQTRTPPERQHVPGS